MRGLAAVALVAACGTPDGLTLEVIVDDPSIASVELFVGDHCYHDCPRGVVAPGLSPMPVTNAYLVVDDAAWVVTKNEFQDGMAGFRIESPDDVTLPILVVVAYDEANAIKWSHTFHHVEIPSASTTHWQVRLSATTPIEIAPAPAQSERIARWSRPDRPACLLVEHWSDSPDPVRDLLGPADDPDCDQAPEGECAPWTANATNFPPTIATADCLAAVTSGTGTRCVLAGPLCNERTPSLDSCEPLLEPYCTPNVMCQCASNPTVDCLDAAATEGTNQGAMPYVKCIVRVDANGAACDGSPIPLDARALLGANTTRQCTAIRVNEIEIPFGPFGNVVAIDQTSKLELGDFTDPCNTTVFFKGTAIPKLVHGFAEVELDNAHHLVVPLKIELKSDCSQPSTCDVYPVLSGNDASLASCITSAPPITCEGDPTNSDCAGPPCGSQGQCCGVGEQCFDGVCGCGNEFNQCQDGDICVSSTFDGSLCGTICCGRFTECPQMQP